MSSLPLIHLRTLTLIEMDQLATGISVACSQAMQTIRDELEVKAFHHAAIDIFQNRFAELGAQMSEQARQIQVLEKENAALKANQIDELQRDHGDICRRELERIKRSNHATAQSLQEKLRTLQAMQTQHAAAIQELNKKFFSPSRTNAQVLARDFDALRRQFDGRAETLGTLDTQCASLVQASSEQAAQMQRLSDSLGTQREHAEGLVGVRDFLARLREVQNEQVRMVDVLAAEQGSVEVAISRLEAGSGAGMSALQASAQDMAGVRRTDERAIASLNDGVAQSDQSIWNSKRHADVLREEMLALTRTMINVTRAMGDSALPQGRLAARVDYVKR